jgi:uncharacterized protein YqhQ
MYAVATRKDIDEVLNKVRKGREQSSKLMNNTGVWVQQITTKHNPKSN